MGEGSATQWAVILQPGPRAGIGEAKGLRGLKGRNNGRGRRQSLACVLVHLVFRRRVKGFAPGLEGCISRRGLDCFWVSQSEVIAPTSGAGRFTRKT